MPRMRGFLHTRPKTDQEDWELVQARTAARLAALFRESTAPEAPVGADATDDDSGVTDPHPGGRPSIVVVGDPPPEAVAAATEATEIQTAQPVGVMAGADEATTADDSWALPIEPAPGPESAPDAGPARPARATRPTRKAATPPRAPRPVRAARPSRRLAPAAPTPAPVMPAAVPAAHCPYCAALLDPPPTVNRRCERCRQRIMVRRVAAQAVYLTEAAVAVFEAERRRLASSARWSRERDRWLHLASAAGAPAPRVAQLASARLTEAVVAASRALYLTTVERAVRAARRESDWEHAARLRREEALALHRLAGSPRPATPDVVALYRDGVAAELRGIAEISRDAELVSATCCDACRADDGHIGRISVERRTPRLPHAGCPRGLCRCHWDLAVRDRKLIGRYLRRRPAAPSRDRVEGAAPEA